METLITFESQFRERLLDIIYGQGSLLGIPYSIAGFVDEVIDPEALFWCLLEFLPQEPRVRDLYQWFFENKSKILVKRIDRLSEGDESFSKDYWGLLLREIHLRRQDYGKSRSSKFGRVSDQPATLLIRARDLFGLDARPYLLTFLLANPNGGRLRELGDTTGYTYRAFFEVAVSWANIGIVSNDAGFCRLVDPEPFKALLKLGEKRIVWINWRTVFETSVRLLRDLSKARSKGFDEGSVIFSTLLKEAKAAIKAAAWRAGDLRETSIGRLLEIFP